MPLNAEQESKKHFEMHKRIEEKNNVAQVKPDWITDQQWAANPNIYHWERSRKAMQYNEQSTPVTYEQAVEQERRNRIMRGEDPKVYDDFLNKRK